MSTQLESLQGKRKRILDGYFDGVITKEERATRIAAVEKEEKTIRDIAGRQTLAPDLSLETLVEAFAPFAEFDLLNREHKRRLLNTLTASVVAANYKIEGLWIGLDMNRTDKDWIGNERIYLKIAA
jgi:hypothetical protein